MVRLINDRAYKTERARGSGIGGRTSWEDVMAFVETRMKNFMSSNCTIPLGNTLRQK
jgi:hypothetical protein